MHPGYIDTPLLSHIRRDVYDGLVGLHPIGRLGTTDEVGNVVHFLLSDKASCVSGSQYGVDGAYPTRKSGCGSITPVPQVCSQIAAVLLYDQLDESAAVEIHDRPDGQRRCSPTRSDIGPLGETFCTQFCASAVDSTLSRYHYPSAA